MAKVSNKEAKIVKQVVQSWQQEGVLKPEEGDRLVAALQVAPFDWKRLAKYSILTAIIAAIISVVSLLSDISIQQLLKFIIDAPPMVKSIWLAIFAAAFYIWGGYWKKTKPGKIYTTEGIFFFAVLLTAGAIYWFGLAITTGSKHFSLLLLAACFIYGVIGFFVQSRLIWLFALLSLGGWFGAETGYVSDWGAYYLRMNYPVRFVFFGAILTTVALVLPTIPNLSTLKYFDQVNLVMGLLYLFIALWILSITGNYDSIDHWLEVKQYELLHWSLLFGVVALAAIYHGVKYENNTTKGFGLTFLFINLYTRFFEFGWNHLHKGIFFAILAISFWFLGTKAEKLWHIGESK